jgi:AcrR family transcriptional regulator
VTLAALPKPSADRILLAAERVFARHGYGETSLRQLIAASGVSTTAFYARFASKEAVLDALVARLLGDLHAAATNALGAVKSLEDGFDRGVDVLVETMAAHKPLARLTLTEAAASAGASATLRRSYGLLADLLAARLRQVAERGTIEVGDADAFAWALIGALQIQVLRWAVWGELDDAALSAALRATARTMLPAVVRRRTTPVR